MKPFTSIAILVFSLISVAQLLRLLFQVEVTASGTSIPLWPSLIAAALFGGLAYMLWRENSPRK